MFQDSSIRSLVKGISWRMFASTDTFLLALLVTGKTIIAAPIALSEVMTKLLLYYFHERIWTLVSWGRNENKSSAIRSLAKSISWRFWGTLDTVMLSFLISGSVQQALTIGSFEVFTKILFFFVHERIWAQIQWGRKFIKLAEND
jgi:uncharacterized membrane protein